MATDYNDFDPETQLGYQELFMGITIMMYIKAGYTKEQALQNLQKDRGDCAYTERFINMFYRVWYKFRPQDIEPPACEIEAKRIEEQYNNITQHINSIAEHINTKTKQLDRCGMYA